MSYRYDVVPAKGFRLGQHFQSLLDGPITWARKFRVGVDFIVGETIFATITPVDEIDAMYFRETLVPDQ